MIGKCYLVSLCNAPAIAIDSMGQRIGPNSQDPRSQSSERPGKQDAPSPPPNKKTTTTCLLAKGSSGKRERGSECLPRVSVEWRRRGLTRSVSSANE